MERRRSEAVVVGGDEAHDLVEAGEVLEDAVLENGVELVLEAGEDGRLLVLVQSVLLEALVPVESVQVHDLKFVQHEAHACVHLRLVQELVRVQGAPLLWAS